MDILKKNYAALHDSELLRIAHREASDLLPQALAVLKQELERRNLMDDRQLLLVGAQPEKSMDSDLEDLIVRFQDTLCPICEKNRAINRYESWVAFSFKFKRSILGCSSCLTKEIESDSTFSAWTALFDLFILPLSIFTVPKVRAHNKRVIAEVKRNTPNTPTELLRQFVRDNRQVVTDLVDNQEESGEYWSYYDGPYGPSEEEKQEPQ
jgi:hypothetical protein